ncbi:MAG TPA: flagellar basal body-associated FliL family protein [Alphaproteobacteria bacterium]|nr:flagellar basal body-associated FliL family protein [Micavibrio sp.]MBK9563478.1 flagellar basal body-associated FliL family protein [Micavibrio sp.]HQX27203.1 flagellar basal body-associated FliL family protein [Alphaproteobacteria bacterium]
MRMILIAVVALLVLGGGGAGAYFYFSKPAEASAGEAAKEVAATHKKEEKKKGGGHGGGGTEFVELDPLILPIIDSSGVTQTVSLVIALEVADKDKAEEVKKLTPRLKDAYIQDMYGVLNKHAALKGGVVQVAAVKSRLTKITTDVLGEDMVSEVLLQVVQQRPI